MIDLSNVLMLPLVGVVIDIDGAKESHDYFLRMSSCGCVILKHLSMSLDFPREDSQAQ